MNREDIIKKDKDHVWHPYTQMKEYVEETDPLVIERSKGIFLFDKNGKKYIDGNSSWWVNNLGHKNPKLLNALKKQMDTMPHCALAGITHESAANLAEKLVNIAPQYSEKIKLNKVFYSDNGSTAVEVAVKMSFQYWQQNNKPKKTKFVTLNNAFHGETIGASSVCGIDLFKKIYSPLLFNTYKAPSPYCYRCPVTMEKSSCNTECFKLMEDILTKNSSEIVAVIVEPMVQGAAGMLIYPKEYLLKLRKLTEKLNIFLIADEVFTGFGRTGELFACDHPKITPDFLCLSKGLTGGFLPFAATLTTDRIYNGFYDNNKTFYYGHSYCGNPLGTSLALEVINIFKNGNIINSLKPKVILFKNLLQEFKKLDIVGDVRQIGLIGAIEIVSNKDTKKVFDPKQRFGKAFYTEALKMGAYLRPLGDVIYFVPPLTINKAELEKLLSIAYDAIQKAYGNTNMM